MKNIDRYQITVNWSDEDQTFIARVPAFKHVAADGATPEDAIREARIALQGVLDVMGKENMAIPEPDLAFEELRRFAPVLNLSALARMAGINKHTLATKLRRGTRFTDEESQKIREALML